MPSSILSHWGRPYCMCCLLQRTPPLWHQGMLLYLYCKHNIGYVISNKFYDDLNGRSEATVQRHKTMLLYVHHWLKYLLYLLVTTKFKSDKYLDGCCRLVWQTMLQLTAQDSSWPEDCSRDWDWTPCILDRKKSMETNTMWSRLTMVRELLGKFWFKFETNNYTSKHMFFPFFMMNCLRADWKHVQCYQQCLFVIYWLNLTWSSIFHM